MHPLVSSVLPPHIQDSTEGEVGGGILMGEQPYHQKASDWPTEKQGKKAFLKVTEGSVTRSLGTNGEGPAALVSK
jgi:hypothetical protein